MAKAASTITKTEAVRLAMEKLGKDVPAEAAMKFVKDEHGLELSKSHFYNIKTTLSKKTGKKRGRPRKIQDEATPAVLAAPIAAPAVKPVRAAINLADLQT